MTATSTASPIDPASLEGVLRPRPEASLLPSSAYSDGDVLEWELRHLFEPSWVCVGREEDASEPGDLFTARVGSESVLVVRAEDGVLRGFYNVCQHRGTQLVSVASMRGAGPLICPYHSWTYGLDGRLRAAQHMREARGFDRAACGLTPVPLETLGGWVFVRVGGDATEVERSLVAYLGDFPARIERYHAGALRRGGRREYEVGANWKLLSENYQECYHCPTIHPDLTRVTPYRSGRDDRGEGPWLGGPMDLAPGCTTMTMTGTTDRPPIPGLPEADHALVFYYTVLPNLWVSLHPDYVMTHAVWPLAPDRTRIVCEWLFHPDAIASPGFDASDAIEFWDTVNGQDWQACERVQRAIGSRGFRGGRFSDMEGTIHRLSAMFARSYLEGRIVRSEELDLSGAPADAAS